MFLTVWASVVVGGAARAARASVAAAGATGSIALAAGAARAAGAYAAAAAAHKADHGDSVSVCGGDTQASAAGRLGLPTCCVCGRSALETPWCQAAGALVVDGCHVCCTSACAMAPGMCWPTVVQLCSLCPQKAVQWGRASPRDKRWGHAQDA